MKHDFGPDLTVRHMAVLLHKGVTVLSASPVVGVGVCVCGWVGVCVWVVVCVCVHDEVPEWPCSMTTTSRLDDHHRRPKLAEPRATPRPPRQNRCWPLDPTQLRAHWRLALQERHHPGSSETEPSPHTPPTATCHTHTNRDSLKRRTTHFFFSSVQQTPSPNNKRQ